MGESTGEHTVIVDDPRYTVTHHTAAHADVITLDGEFDLFTQPTIRAALANCELTQHRRIYDLNSVSFIDSSMVALLVFERRRALGEGRQMVLVSHTTPARKVLAIVGMDRVLPVYDTLSQALAG